MVKQPVAVSTTLHLGPSADVESEGVSPQVLRLIQQDQLRLLRAQMVSAGALTLAAGTAWIVSELKFPGAMSFLLGYLTVIGLFKTATAARAWWLVRERDPVAAAAEASRDRQLTAALETRVAAREPYATYAIMATLVAIALVQVFVVGSLPRTISAAGLDKARVAAGEWWRLLTAAFLHGSGYHLSANLSALLVFGRIVELYSTRSRFLFAYVAAVIAGGLASYWLLPHTASIGASGGILGLVAFTYALSLRRPDDVPVSYGRAAIATMVLTGLIGAVGFRFIDNAAHAGGALAGFLICWLTVPHELPRAERAPSRYNDDRAMPVLGALAAVVLVGAAVSTATQLVDARPRAVTSLRMALEPRGDGQFDVLLENLRDVPLEAYSLNVYASGMWQFQQWRDEVGSEGPPAAGRGMIAPHERRLVPLGDPGSSLKQPNVQVVAALFADGRYEGSWDEYNTITERRTAAAADADFWIAVIDDVRAEPADQRADFIKSKIGERARINRLNRRPTDAAEIAFVMHLAVDTPDRFDADVERERARLVSRRDELRRSVR
ncbi:MAG TPA: rhomboid family intramembrane serine protease [Vicinamibacterales bacterium]|nr:rhomboid family intramembrane serine protease [Vicinamibacterales bacterium]